MIDWNTYYNSFNETREAEKEKRAQQDTADRLKVNQLVGNVEREGLKEAEKGKGAKRSALDVSQYQSAKDAKSAYDNYNQAAGTQMAKPGWENQLNLGRSDSEAKSPWDKIGERMLGVQSTVNRVNQQTRTKQRDDALKQAQEDFNKRSREIMANDSARTGTAAEQNAKFAEAINRYAEMARDQEKRGRKVVTSPYAQAMSDCREGRGPCPPDMNTSTGVSSSLDPNNLSTSGQTAYTQAQLELKRRLDKIREDEGFSYGTGTDATSWF